MEQIEFGAKFFNKLHQGRSLGRIPRRHLDLEPELQITGIRSQSPLH